jgi:hypothetical protein
MASPVTNHQHSFPTVLQREQIARSAQKEVFQTDHLTFVLQFFFSKNLAKLASTNRVFQSKVITAAEWEIRTKKTLSFRELYDFAKHISPNKYIVDFNQISPFLVNLTELNLSNWNFTNESFLHLRTLSPNRHRQITSLNFTSTHNLTLGKLKSLLTRIPSFNDHNFSLIPNLNSLNFRNSHPGLYPIELLNECDFFISGQGTYTYSDGDKYEGQWLEGQKSGQGTETYSDGGKYEGQWLEGQKSGQGTETYPDGAKYEGQWLGGQESGQGTATYPDGSKYEGQWLGEKQSGQGTETYPDGVKYEGQWLEGRRSGQGIVTNPAGAKYEGQWLEGQESGQGILTYPDGRKYEGQWLEGIASGQGTWTDPNGAKYEGLCLEEKQNWFERP